ncbi:MAG: hypothetical protein Q9208_007268 [Pyrenodesmia sp. 3 TL-2023]
MEWAAVNQNPGSTMASLGQPSPPKADPASSTSQISEPADQLSLEKQQGCHVKRKALAHIPAPNAPKGLDSRLSKSSSDITNTDPTTPRRKRRKLDEIHALAQCPPKTSISKKTTRSPEATRTPQSRTGDNRSSESPNPAQRRKPEARQCGSRHGSTAGSFEAVHIPIEGIFEATASGQKYGMLPPLRKQPPRASKTMRSIENEVNPRDGRDTPYGWDEPTVYDASYIEQRKREDHLNGIGPGDSPAHEPDRAFTPVSTPSVSDAATTPSNRRYGARAKSRQDDDQSEYPAVSERCATSKHHRRKLSSPSKRVKREVTEAIEDASAFLYRSAIPRDVDVVAISESDFYITQIRGLERQIAALRRRVEVKEDLKAYTQRECQRAITNVEDLLKRSMQAPCPGLMGAPKSVNGAGHGQENRNPTSSAGGLDLTSVSNVSSKPQTHPLLEDSGALQPIAANRAAVPHAKRASPDTTGGPPNRTRGSNPSSPSSQSNPCNQTTPRTRSTDPNGQGWRQKSGRRDPESHSFSVPSTPSPPNAKESRSTGPRSARRRGLCPSSTPGGQPFSPHREASRPKTHVNEHASSSSTCQQRHDGTASDSTSKPDVVYAAGRGPFPERYTKADPSHETKEEELQNSILKKDKGKQRSLNSDCNHTTQSTEHQNAGGSAIGAANGRSRETSEETNEFPSVATVLQRDNMSREQACQPRKGHQAKKQVDLQALNTAEGHNTQAGGKVSETHDNHFAAHRCSYQPISAPGDAPQTLGDGAEPAAKRRCCGTSGHQENQTTLSHPNKPPSGSQSLVKWQSGKKNETRRPWSTAKQEEPTRPADTKNIASREAYESLTSQPDRKVSSHVRRRSHEMSSFPQRRPFSMNGPMRKWSPPLSTIQRWNPDQCVCIHLPDMFRNTLKPNLWSWPGIKDQFLHHCEQVMSCPAHPEVTRRTCRKLHSLEAPVHEREMEHWERETLMKKGLLTHGTIVANAFYGNQAPRALSRQPHDLPQAVDVSDKFDQSTADVRVSIEEPQPSSSIVHGKPLRQTSPTLAGLPRDSFQPTFGLPTPLGSSPTVQSEASQLNQSQHAEGLCPSSPPQLAASAKCPNPMERKTPKSSVPATKESKGSPDNSPLEVTETPTRDAVNSPPQQRRSRSSNSTGTGTAPIEKLSSITRLSNEQASDEAFDHFDVCQLPDIDDDDVTQSSLPPSDQSANAFVGEGSGAFPAQSDPSSSSHKEHSEVDEANSGTIPPSLPKKRTSSLRPSVDLGTKKRKSKGWKNEGKTKEKAGQEDDRYRGQEAAREEEEKGETIEEEDGEEDEEMKRKREKTAKRERKKKEKEEETKRMEQAEAKRKQDQEKREKKKRKEEKEKRKQKKEQKKAANAEASHNPTTGEDGYDAQAEPCTNHGIAEQETTDRVPTTQGALKRGMVQPLPAATGTLCKPERIPYDERVSDAELIRIGRLTSPAVRYWAARYAFRADGKLRTGFYYLVKKKDQDGDGWDEDLKKRLLPEK